MKLLPTSTRNKFNIKKTRIYLLMRQLYWRYGVAAIRKMIPAFHLKGTGNSNSARYCYAVYMRHIVCLFKNGIERLPLRVAEFGPGESLGIGLCAMLAGADEYYGLDVVEHTNKADNLKMFDELITFFKEKSVIPDANEFPGIHITLDDYSFPNHIITDTVLEKTLSEQRIKAIKYLLNSTVETSYNNMTIKYIVPWENYSGVYPKVDWVFSQAVLEHIDNLSHFYDILKQIILPQGFTSHDIDFRSHDETYTWNGHWAILDKKWKRIRGTRPYLINREPLSTHLQLFKENGFLILEFRKHSGSGEEHPSINRNKLTGKFSNLSDEDFGTSTCFIICKMVC